MSLPLESEAPDFDLPAWTPRGVARIRLRALRGSWVVLFFYPADFSFICPTEVRGFAAAYGAFRDAGAEVLGCSPDDVESHRAWSEELGGIPYPLLADADNRVAVAYGAAVLGQRRPERATYILDPDGRVLFVMKVARNVGRGVTETLRVLRALQTGRLCPADWHPGDPTAELPEAEVTDPAPGVR